MRLRARWEATTRVEARPQRPWLCGCRRGGDMSIGSPRAMGHCLRRGPISQPKRHGRRQASGAEVPVTRRSVVGEPGHSATIQAWVGESDQLAKEVAYGQLPGFACGADMEQTRIALSEDYVHQAEAVVEEQLAKAGYRLAYLLNRALGD